MSEPNNSEDFWGCFFGVVVWVNAGGRKLRSSSSMNGESGLSSVEEDVGETVPLPFSSLRD